MTNHAWIWIMRASGLLTVFYGVVGYVGWHHLAKQGLLHVQDWRVVIACVVFVGLCLIVGSYLRPFGHLDDELRWPKHHPR